MKDGHVEVSTLSDISANMFAVLVLILIMAAMVTGRPAAQNAHDRVIVESDLDFVTRSALTPAAMVEMLYDRRRNAQGTSVDLFDSRIVITRPNQDDAVLQSSNATPEFLRARLGSAAWPVRLYVFSNAFYAPVTEELGAAGATYQELSTPVALRRPDGDGWSQGFKALSAQATSLSEFRNGLARILGGGPHPAPTRTAGRPEGQAFAADFAARFIRLLTIAWNVVVSATAIAVIAWIEMRTRGDRRGAA